MKPTYILQFLLLFLMSLAHAQNVSLKEQMIDQGVFNKTPIFNEGYSTINKDSLKKAPFHYDVSIGTFIPTYKAKLIGVKPTLGISVGFKNKRTTYDLTVDTRFGRTKDEYQLANLNETNHYMGGYVGLDILRDVWTNNKSQILLLGGFGMDLFEIEPAIYRDPTFWETVFYGDDRIIVKDSKNIFSPNLNLGLMFRYYHKSKNYFGIRYRYNIVDYNSNKILTDITGNFHSITLSFGGVIKQN